MLVFYVCVYLLFSLSLPLVFLLFSPRKTTKHIIFRNKWVHKFRMFRSFIHLVFLLRSINFFKKSVQRRCKIATSFVNYSSFRNVNRFFSPSIASFSFGLLFVFIFCSHFLFLSLSLSHPLSCSVAKANVIETKSWLKEMGKMKAKENHYAFEFRLPWNKLFQLDSIENEGSKESVQKISYVEFLKRIRKGMYWLSSEFNTKANNHKWVWSQRHRSMFDFSMCGLCALEGEWIIYRHFLFWPI